MAEPDASATTPAPSRTAKWTLFIFLGVWFGIQVLVPLRHLLYPGSPSWNEQGHKFAWQMKLRDKKARAVFTVYDPASGKKWHIRPRRILARHQARKVGTRPELILQFAHHLADVWALERKIEGVQVRARVCASLNGRKPALLIDPNRDLMRIEYSVRHADWVLPLRQPFERPPGRTRRRGLNC